MSHSPRALLSATRPVEALLFELPRMAVTVLIDRRTGALAFAGEAFPRDEDECEALRQTARGEGPPLMVMAMRPALARVADAVAHAERLGRAVPDWLRWRFGLPELVHPLGTGRCYACDAALARGDRARGEHARCPACRAGAGDGADSALGRAWLMLAAGLPARALCLLVTAVQEGAAAADIAALRGVAHLALGDSDGAFVHLSEALFARPNELRWQGWLAAAVDLQHAANVVCAEAASGTLTAAR